MLSQRWNPFRVCSVTAKMFEHQNSGKNRSKRIDFFWKIEQGHIGFDLSKKNQNYLMLVYL
jgi:hypothetical protein